MHATAGICNWRKLTNLQRKARLFKGWLHFFATKKAEIAAALGRTTVRLGPCEFFKRRPQVIARFSRQDIDNVCHVLCRFIATVGNNGLSPTAGTSTVLVFFQNVQDAHLGGRR